MTIAAIIVQGIGPGGTIPFLLTGGLGSTAATAAETARRKLGGPPPGSLKTYLPPGRWIKKQGEPTLEEVKELYKEARETIPAHLQAGLLPKALRLEGRGTKYLPAPSKVDFDALADDFDTLKKLILKIQQIEEEKERIRQRRRRDEDTLMFILNAIDDD